MARPFYPHEADDPDLDWLVSNFLYERPQYIPVDSGTLPLVLLPYHTQEPEKPAEKKRKNRRERVSPKQSELPVIPRPK